MAWTERYCSPSGGGAHDGTSEADAWDLAEAITNYASGHRINVIAGTYANTTTNRTFGTAGTATSPIWWRGYNSTIGDLDDAPTSQLTPGTDMPEFTWTTGRAIISSGADYQSFSSIAWDSATTTTATVSHTGDRCFFRRCRVDNTGTTSSVHALRILGVYVHVEANHIKNTTHGDCLNLGSSGRAFIHGNFFEGGDNGVDAGDTVAVVRNIFDDPDGDAIRITDANNPCYIIGNSIYSPGGDGIELTQPPDGTFIINNIFSEVGGYAINQSSGTDTLEIHIDGNLYHSLTSGELNGITEDVQFNKQTDSSSPFTNAGSDDFTPDSGSNARENGMPGLFEANGPTTYLNIGAVQHQATGGGGVVKLIGVGGGLISGADA